MSDSSTIGLPEAARRLGVKLRLLRRAIRTGKVPAPPHLNALASVSSGWLDRAAAAAAASPTALRQTFAQKAPAFARYRGTSAWHKYPARVRAYARLRAAAKPD